MHWMESFEFARGPAMRRAMPWALWLLLLAASAHPSRGWAQSHSTFPQPIGQPIGGGVQDIPNGHPEEDEKLLRALNADRQKSLVSDTNKLLRLATELNDEIARTSPAHLSDDELRKMARIEKLAHSVKEKMSTSVRGTPAFRPPIQVVP